MYWCLESRALLVEEASYPTVRPCPLGVNGDHSDLARAHRRAVGNARVKLAGGLELASWSDLKTFFVTLTARYDVTQSQEGQDYTLDQLTEWFEYFVLILKRGGGKRGNEFFYPNERGFEFEYARAAEFAKTGVVNHFHVVFRCRHVPGSVLVRAYVKRYRRVMWGIDFDFLRLVWEKASGGSHGVYIEPIDVSSKENRAGAVGYLTKYIAKQVLTNKMRFSTSRGWLPPGSSFMYSRLFEQYAVRYVADCGEFHTDAHLVYAPWVRWLYQNRDRVRFISYGKSYGKG